MGGDVIDEAQQRINRGLLARIKALEELVSPKVVMATADAAAQDRDIVQEHKRAAADILNTHYDKR